MENKKKENKLKQFRLKVMNIIKKYGLLDKSDKIVVGISGGKDSLALLDILKELGFNVSAFHIYLGINKESFSENSLKIIKDFCKERKINLYVFDLRKLNKTVEDYKGPRPKCSFCGLVKRYLITKFARDFGFTALATGHHFDDEISFIFSNLLNFNLNYLARQGPIIEGKDLPKKVKPFYEVKEKEIIEYCELRGIKYLKQNCPFSKSASQYFYKQLLEEIELKRPGFKKNLLKKFLNNKQLICENKEELKKCKICGMPSNNEICSFCRLFGLKKELNLKKEVEINFYKS
jgi:uncharacterized protein (TIGR00269 family)